MIIDFFILLAATVLNLFIAPFKGIEWALPDKFETAIIYFVSYAQYVQNIVPVSDLMEAIGTFLTFLALWQTFQLVKKWLLPAIPGTNFVHHVEGFGPHIK